MIICETVLNCILSSFSGEENCIQIEGQLIKPFQFEEMCGKGSSKNWKMSILCESIPLKTLIEVRIRLVNVHL